MQFDATNKNGIVQFCRSGLLQLITVFGIIFPLDTGKTQIIFCNLSMFSIS